MVIVMLKAAWIPRFEAEISKHSENSIDRFSWGKARNRKVRTIARTLDDKLANGASEIRNLSPMSEIGSENLIRIQRGCLRERERENP